MNRIFAQPVDCGPKLHPKSPSSRVRAAVTRGVAIVVLLSAFYTVELRQHVSTGATATAQCRRKRSGRRRWAELWSTQSLCFRFEIRVAPPRHSEMLLSGTHNVVRPTFTLKMEAACISEAPVPTSQTRTLSRGHNR